MAEGLNENAVTTLRKKTHIISMQMFVSLKKPINNSSLKLKCLSQQAFSLNTCLDVRRPLVELTYSPTLNSRHWSNQFCTHLYVFQNK